MNPVYSLNLFLIDDSNIMEDLITAKNKSPETNQVTLFTEIIFRRILGLDGYMWVSILASIQQYGPHVYIKCVYFNHWEIYHCRSLYTPETNLMSIKKIFL